MNKKKLLTLVLTLALIGAVGVGATLAYFTDKDSALNVVTMGNVNIELTEDAWTYGDDGITGVTPGQKIAKNPTITLDANSLDAYVRMKLTVNGLSDDDAKDVLDELNIQDGWTLAEDGYYYYAQPLTQQNKTATLFTEVTIPYGWNNDYANVEFSIDVTAEAIQANNLKEATETEAGFFNEDGSWNITAEKILPFENEQ